MEKELEGLIHVTELNLEPSLKVEEFFKVGDKVVAKVVKVDNEQRKIGLSMKDSPVRTAVVQDTVQEEVAQAPETEETEAEETKVEETKAEEISAEEAPDEEAKQEDA